MRSGRLWEVLVNLRAALVVALFIGASLPQVAGAHPRNGDGLQASLGLHQLMAPPVDLAGGTSGHCQLGQECFAMAILVVHADGPPPVPVPTPAYLRFQHPTTGAPVSFDPPPPRMS